MTQVQKDILASEIGSIAQKVFAGERITEADALQLFSCNTLSHIGYLANFVNQKKSGDKVFYNKNIHIEPTNICAKSCKFCSFAKKEGDKDAWFYSVEEIMNTIEEKKKGITEVHIVGGLHKTLNLEYYKNLFAKIRQTYPDITIKALTAEEIHYISKIERKSVKEVLRQLIEAGLQTLPGGGAEIFADRVRKEICAPKLNGAEWLEVHEEAHGFGLDTNATMLYGHIETLEERVNHMFLLRELQDKTGGFNAFIPLKYKSQNNDLLEGETTIIDDFKTYAIARLFLDNFQHLKAYWPMLGRDNAELLLNFGVDDIDGTIEDTTKIYSMAGASEQIPTMSVSEIQKIAQRNKKQAIERDSFYNMVG